MSTPEERDFFCQLLYDQKKHFKIEIYHYVVMSNHFHLSIETLDTKTLSAYIGRVSALYSRYWHRTMKAGNGTVWQGRFKSLIVQKELYLNRLGRYIERNPVTAEIEDIVNPEDYKWSSAAAYISGKTEKLINPSRHPYRLNWGNNEEECSRNYRKYINNSQDDEEREFFSSGGAVLGDKKFKSNIQLIDGRLSARKRGKRKMQ
jgi:REP-associated tyrosine transposase